MPKFERLSIEKENARLELYEAGFSDEDAAEVLGIAVSAYGSWRRDRGLPNVNKRETMSLCWKCKNTNRFDCSWFDPDDPQPVKGWIAKPTEIYCNCGYDGSGRSFRHATSSYHVYECPNFDIMEEYNPENAIKTANGRVAVRRRV